MSRSLVGLAALGLVVITGTALAVDWPNKIPTKDERGQTLYDRHCVACHGPLAKGDGPLAASLVTPVPDLSKGFGGKPRDELVRIVMKGRGTMPGFEQSLRDLWPASGDLREYARDVLDHMENLEARKKAPKPVAKPDAPAKPEEEPAAEGPGADGN